MFNKINNMISGFGGDTPDQEDINILPDEAMEEDEYADMTPEQILDDPASPFELQKQALQQIKDRYLKPRDNNEN